jgi:hypothetical protein
MRRRKKEKIDLRVAPFRLSISSDLPSISDPPFLSDHPFLPYSLSPTEKDSGFLINSGAPNRTFPPKEKVEHVGGLVSEYTSQHQKCEVKLGGRGTCSTRTGDSGSGSE